MTYSINDSYICTAFFLSPLFQMFFRRSSDLDQHPWRWPNVGMERTSETFFLTQWFVVDFITNNLTSKKSTCSLTNQMICFFVWRNRKDIILPISAHPCRCEFFSSWIGISSFNFFLSYWPYLCNCYFCPNGRIKMRSHSRHLPGLFSIEMRKTLDTIESL